MKQILLYFIAFAFLGCDPAVINKNNDQEKKEVVELPSIEDYKIINSTFVHLADPNLWGDKREFGYDNYSNQNKNIPDEYLGDIYFNQYLCSLEDSLCFQTPLIIKEIPLSNLTSLDFQKLGRALMSNKDNGLKLDTTLIQNIGFNRLIPINVDQRAERKTGEKTITYSRIIYNNEKNKACFYFQKNSSGLSGFGAFVFVEKINGIWTIKQRLEDWVS